MSLQLLDWADPQWDRVISRLPHDTYHTAGYCAACASSESGEIRLAVIDDGELLVAPLVVRPISSDAEPHKGLVDYSSPYGYPTPLCSSSDPDTQRALLSELLSGLGSLGGVSAFFRSHPFLGLSRGVWEAAGDVVFHGQTVYLDVPAIASDPIRSFRVDHRRQIRILNDLGYVAQSGAWDTFDQFPDLYRKNMRRLGASPYLYFPDDYFTALRSNLGDGLRYITVTAPSGRMAAATLLLICDGIAQYHLSSTAEEYWSDAPSKALFPVMVAESDRAGATRLHLGGGVGARADSLFEFKRGFSKLFADYFSYRVVLNEGVYRALSKSLAPDGFFPAYRYESP